MRPLFQLNDHRRVDLEAGGEGMLGEDWGVFVVRSASDRATVLRIIAGNGMAWDHVSVSTHKRCPTWAEMEQVKRMFFTADETAMQLHVPPSDHINIHPYVLHLWRPHDAAIPLPPTILV